MRCSWHYNLIFFLVTLFISPILLDAFLSSIVPRKFCSFINLRNYLVVEEVKSLLRCCFFPTRFSASKLVKTSDCCLLGLELYSAAYNIKNIKTVFQKQKKNKLQQNPANQYYGPWEIQFRTHQHKVLNRLQIEISKADIRDRSRSVDADGSRKLGS